MKKTLLALVISLAVFFVSCKKTEHSIRFTNNYTMEVQGVKAGATDLGTVPSGQSSAYASIPEGDFSITGHTSTGFLQGTGSVSGKGQHKWTITLGSDKILTLVEDN